MLGVRLPKPQHKGPVHMKSLIRRPSQEEQWVRSFQNSPLDSDTASPGQHQLWFCFLLGTWVCGLFGIKALFEVV